jgi:hypothetical protein
MTIIILGLYLSVFFTHEKLISITPKSEVKNLLFYIYQNLLIIIDYTLLRLPPNHSKTSWESHL